MRENKVTLLINDFGVLHLVVSQIFRRVTKVFSFHPFSDLPSYLSIPCVDAFESHSQAINSITSLFNSKIIKEGVKLLGYTKEHNTLSFGFITEVSLCAEFPGHVQIYKVDKVEFIKVNNNEVEEDSEYDAFPIEEYHYFAELLDLTRPFPSFEKVYEPDMEFCWNEKWRNPFVQIGAADVCVVLLQGFASSLIFMGHRICFIVRRAVLNPGVRYIARGLNEKNEPGNECECELIFCSPNNELWTHIYRRGSIPIRWQTNNKLIKVEHVVTDLTTNGTKVYFKRLQSRLFGGQIFCLCLLKSEPDSSESELFSSFTNVINSLKDDNTVRLTAFDLNKTIEEEGPVAAAEQMFRLLSPLASICDFSYSRNVLNDNGYISKDLIWEQRQMCSVRINCADSLDRTNIASFFLALILTSEWSRRSGITKKNAPLFTHKNPVDDIKPEVLEFLVDSYLKSGDYISLLYTNTPAVKTNIIRQFSQAETTQESDASISVKRRFFNTFTDPQRQKLFEKWTKIQNLNPTFFLDHMKTISAGFNFPAEIFFFNESPKQVLKTNSHIFSVLIPFDVKITAIYFHLVPCDPFEIPQGLSIEAFDGINHYMIEKDLKLPAVANNCTIKINVNAPFVRIINIQFPDEGKQVYIGPIGFEGTLKGKEYFYQEKECVHKIALDEFAIFVREAFKKKPVTFEASQNLELQRIQLGVSKYQFWHACFLNRINPSFFLPIPVPNECIFCGSSDAIHSYFCFSPIVPHRLYMSTEEIEERKQKSLIYVCNDCLEKANLLVRQTEGIHRDLKYDGNDHKTTRKLLDFSDFDITIPHAVTQFCDAYVLQGAPNGILNGTASVQISNPQFIVIALSFPCELEHMEIQMDPLPDKFDVQVMNEDGTFDKTVVCPKETDQMYWVGMTNPKSYRQLAFTINISTPITIHKITAFGSPTIYKPAFIRGKHEIRSLPDLGKKESISLYFDSDLLTHSFTLLRESHQFIMKVEKKGPFDPFIGAVFLNKSKIVHEEYFHLGETPQETTLYYPISVNEKFTVCTIYHVACKDPSKCSNISFFVR